MRSHVTLKAYAFALPLCSLGLVLFATPLSAQYDHFPMGRARKALRAIGADIEGSSERCGGCHDPNLVKINDWAVQAYRTSWRCLIESRGSSGENLTAKARIDCLRSDPSDPDSHFSPKKLGLLTAGAHLSQFQKLFQAAYPNENWQARYNQFRLEVSMPKNAHKMTEEEFKDVQDWFLHQNPRTPYLEDLLGDVSDIPTTCEESRSPELRSYLLGNRQKNWRVRNQELGLKMFACDPKDPNPLNCFSAKRANGWEIFEDSRNTSFGKSWTKDYPEQRLRILTKLNFKPLFWTRSSPDGRFVANGVDGKTIKDNEAQRKRSQTLFAGRINDLLTHLLPNTTQRVIEVKAYYDPTFFPDNSGFIFQGERNGFCTQTILEDQTTTRITFTEDGCVERDNVTLYQSVGASLDGADYFAAAGQFESDFGSSWAVLEPTWLSKSYLRLYRIIHNGLNHEVVDEHSFWTPFQADFQLAPSTNLLVSRVAGRTPDRVLKQMGFVINALSYNFNAAGNQKVSWKPLARFCISGGKASFSYDERFLVTYARVQPEDFAVYGFQSPAAKDFKKLIGTHNIILVDLWTGQRHRITTMQQGQHAKFPHFRSDGWIYFLVDDKDNGSFVVASDAAIRIEQKQPIFVSPSPK